MATRCVIEWGDPRLPSRYWEHVHACPNTGCWLWSGSSGGRGYGYFFLRKGEFPELAVRKKPAHNLMLYVAEPGHTGVLARHTCDVTWCVNPEHLLPGDALLNAADMMERGRHVAWNRRSVRWCDQHQRSFRRYDRMLSSGKLVDRWACPSCCYESSKRSVHATEERLARHRARDARLHREARVNASPERRKRVARGDADRQRRRLDAIREERLSELAILPDPETLRALVRAHIELAGISQAEFGRRAEVGFIDAFLAAKSKLSVEKLMRVVAYLGSEVRPEHAGSGVSAWRKGRDEPVRDGYLACRAGVPSPTEENSRG